MLGKARELLTQVLPSKAAVEEGQALMPESQNRDQKLKSGQAPASWYVQPVIHGLQLARKAVNVI